ncbi:hypothetical protein AMECASPLE_037021 [Ameca splendens]|uniref:Uncharacterized protein n=1 Tax=Ameca splendens TaxID=208324 RepID=A0ABV0XKV9_9TELE
MVMTQNLGHERGGRFRQTDLRVRLRAVVKRQKQGAQVEQLTPDRHFVLDYHPIYSNIIIGAGFSVQVGPPHSNTCQKHLLRKASLPDTKPHYLTPLVPRSSGSTLCQTTHPESTVLMW